jgi:hypothetical protein
MTHNPGTNFYQKLETPGSKNKRQNSAHNPSSVEINKLSMVRKRANGNGTSLALRRPTENR